MDPRDRISEILAGISPHQRMRRSSAQTAGQFDRATPHDSEVTERASMLPLATYANGKTGIAFPGIVASPVENFYKAATGQIEPQTDEFRNAGFEAAGAAMSGGLLAPRPMGSLGASGRPVQQAAPRQVDSLGYYSALDEALGSFRPTDKLTAQTLQQRGVKLSEIEARGLKPLLDSGAVPVSDLMETAGRNRVEVKEANYDRKVTGDKIKLGGRVRDVGDTTKWSTHSLDPSNPTYRETVLHLPEVSSVNFDPAKLTVERGPVFAKVSYDGKLLADDLSSGFGEDGLRDIGRRMVERTHELRTGKEEAFRSGHFPEPNIIGHMMTSMTRHQGKPVYTIDQIQSDWGQKLRDGGVRDEAKIAELKTKLGSVGDYSGLSIDSTLRQHGRSRESLLTARDEAVAARNAELSRGMDWPSSKDKIDELNRAISLVDDPGYAEFRRLAAELRTAESSPVGHPLVNTTDQWVNTTLRRGLRQAVDGGAEYVAIPSGRTVLSYNPGDTHGMNTFYDSIVPKNLFGMMRKADPSVAMSKVDTLDTPGRGAAGQGFTLLPITPQVRDYVGRGLPLFSNPLPASAGGLLAQYRGESSEDRIARILAGQ